MNRFLKSLLLGAYLLVAPLVSSPASAAQDGSITISVKEYERLKNLEEGDSKKQYWKMSFEQILSKESNNYTKAWDLYEFWVLRTVYLEERVDDRTVDAVISKINTLNKTNSTPITLIVSSPGGGVLSGFRLVNAMKSSIAPVNTVCNSYALSMGAVIFSVGKQRVATEGCVFMLHDVGVGANGGQTMEHVKWTETIISIENQLVDILSDASGLDDKEVRTLMEYETFWTGEETYRLGFADEYFAKKRGVPDRDIPEDLLPLYRMKNNFDRKLDK